MILAFSESLVKAVRSIVQLSGVLQERIASHILIMEATLNIFGSKEVSNRKIYQVFSKYSVGDLLLCSEPANQLNQSFI